MFLIHEGGEFDPIKYHATKLAAGIKIQSSIICKLYGAILGKNVPQPQRSSTLDALK